MHKMPKRETKQGAAETRNKIEIKKKTRIELNVYMHILGLKVKNNS